MQYLFFVFSGVVFTLSGFLMFWVRRNSSLLFSKIKINRVVKLTTFDLPMVIFKSQKYELISMENYTFTLKFKGENWLKIQFLVDDSQICSKVEIGQKDAVYGVLGEVHSTKLCVKQQNSTVLCQMHSTIKILIQKNKLPFRVGVNKNIIKFDDFKFELQSEGKIELKIFDDLLQYEVTKANSVTLDYSSLELQNLSRNEIKQTALENFGLPQLNFDKPDFSQIYKKGLKGEYTRKCVQNVRFTITRQPTKNNINLTKFGLSKWLSVRKWGQKIIVEDWLTNYKITIRTKTENYFLCCWWGEVFLCLDSLEYDIQTLPFDKIKKGEVNLFNYHFNWSFFPRGMKFDFAYGMLRYMTKKNVSKWLADKDIACFILECLPKNLELISQHYDFVRELYPYIILKPLKQELLLFMQKYEQMFYKIL